MSNTKIVQINLRVPDSVVSDLDQLAEREPASRVELARQILMEGIAHRKQDMALRLYQEGKITKSKAAELAGISLWEMMDLIEQLALPAHYSLPGAIEEVRQMIAQSIV